MTPDAVQTVAVQAQHLLQQIDALLVFDDVLHSPPGQAFVDLLTALAAEDASQSVRAYGAWFRALAAANESWTAHLLRQIAYAENPFTTQAQAADQLPVALVQAAARDLGRLQGVCQMGGDRLAAGVQAIAQWSDPLPIWTLPNQPPSPLPLPTDAPWADAVADLARYYRRHGTGLCAQYRALTWRDGSLHGIADPDPIALDALTAYDHPRQQLVANTQALLAGYPALNVLLYGSRGAGKSSLVKALVNEYAPQGLRLVEVAKADLRALPEIVGLLKARPQTFIIFVDDLSFEEDDDTFKALKVVLEGGAIARPANVVVYATSNRRHLVRESFADRPRPSDQDEIQPWDTVQEKLSFSDRFGLTLTFEPADQPTYLAIVRHLAQQAQIDLPQDELTARALQWATRHNGRSGRSARQFIDWLTAELALNRGL